MGSSDFSAILYRDLLEFAPDALIAVNANGTIVYANANAHALFGYDAGSLSGTSIEQLIPRESRDKHVAHRKGYFGDPRTREMGNRAMALYGLRRDGSKFRAEIRLAPIRTPEGTLSAAAVRDATESERAMTMMAAAKETADEANATKGRFLAAASHDLRQPLQTLRLLNGTLKRLSRDAAILDVLDQEERALSTMSELLNALLNVTKLESGTVQPNISEVALADIFDDLRQQFASPVKLKNLDLLIANTDVMLRTDSTLLREMIQNLLANAVRYTDAGRIVLQCRIESGHTLIEVEDTGVGIPEDVRESIFDDFFQAAARGATHRGGVGLGLGIVRRLSRLLELPVNVTSAIGSGSRFSIDVTAVVCTSVERAPSGAHAVPTRKQGQRVLLVEDEQAMRMALRTYLQLDNHTVQLAGSLGEVNALLEKMDVPPDIVITDFHLGDHERGTDAIETIRKKFGNCVPAIILTGDTSKIPSQLAAQPATRMLNKPIDVEVLTSTMEELLASPGKGDAVLAT